MKLLLNLIGDHWKCHNHIMTPNIYNNKNYITSFLTITKNTKDLVFQTLIFLIFGRLNAML